MVWFFVNEVQLNYALGLVIIMMVVMLQKGQKNQRTCNIPLWLDILVEVRLDKAEPLLDAAFDVSPTFANITEHWLASSVS